MPQVVLMRVHASSSDLFDRQVEIDTFKGVSRAGLGPQLLLLFRNGRIEEFLSQHVSTLLWPLILHSSCCRCDEYWQEAYSERRSSLGIKRTASALAQLSACIAEWLSAHHGGGVTRSVLHQVPFNPYLRSCKWSGYKCYCCPSEKESADMYGHNLCCFCPVCPYVCCTLLLVNTGDPGCLRHP